MRTLAFFCLSFASAIFAAQYLLPLWLLPLAAVGFALLAVLWALALRGYRRRGALLIGFGLAAGLLFDLSYAQLVQSPFEALAGSRETLTLELADYPIETEYGSRAEVRILGRGLHGKAVYYGDRELLALSPGARVRGVTEARSAARIRDTEVSTFTSRGVFLLLYRRGETELDATGAGGLRCLPQRIARRMQEIVESVFPERTRAFMTAILLGDRYGLSQEDETWLSEAGLMHITAVSGLHCAFLLSLARLLVGPGRRKLMCIVTIPGLALYALVAGLTPSVVRACIMLTLLLLAPLFERESDGATSLAFALFLILLRNPFAAKSLSLQLSFAAMAGLLWLTPRLYEHFRVARRSWAGRLLLGSLSATAGALVFTILLSAFYFNSLVLIAPLSNLVCLWAASLTFASGLITVAVGAVSLPAASLLAHVPHLGAVYLLEAARLLASVPYHAVYFSNNLLRLWLVYAYALFAACGFLRSGRRRYPVAAGLAAASLALCVWANVLPMRAGLLHMVTLDIGQGQSVALLSRGSAALVDCGSSSYVPAGDVTADYLQSVGVRRLDYVVISHYHEDHCNGLQVLFSRLKVGMLILPDIEDGDAVRAEVLALAERFDVPVLFIRQTERLPLGGASLTVYPPVAEGDMNEECLTVLCTAGTFDALFTGDMDANTEYLLIAKHALPDIEVLMAGHHGSRYSTGGDLLAETTPEIGVVSCGENNSYGHPHEEALWRMAESGLSVYRTDLQGNIHITVN